MRMWVRSLALLSGLRIWGCHERWCRSQTQLRSGMAGSCSSDSTPSLGTSMCHGCDPKKEGNDNNNKKMAGQVAAAPKDSQYRDRETNGKKGEEHASKAPAFQGEAQRTAFCLGQLETRDTLEDWGLLQRLAAPKTDTRGSKRLLAPEKASKFLQLGIYMHTSLEKIFPHIRFERAPDSLAGLTGKGLSLYKSGPRD